MTIKLTPTNRGFLRGDFRDFYGQACSIQESSLADVAAIWLGAQPNRAHLTQKQVAELMPMLEFFVANGTLPRA